MLSFHLLRPLGYGLLYRLGKDYAKLVAFLLAFLLAGVARADDIRIAVLGDSLVHGYGLSADQGFVPQMQSWLSERGHDVTLINAGVSGDTTAGGLARAAWTIADDIDGVVVSLGGNDVLRGIDPRISAQNLDGILKIASDKKIPALLVGISAPANFGREYQSAFEILYSDLSQKYQVPLYPNFLQILLDKPDRKMTLKTFYQRDALHPNAQGVALIVDDIGPSFEALVQSLQP